MNVLESGEGESLEELAADTSSPDHENFGALQKPQKTNSKTCYSNNLGFWGCGYLEESSTLIAGECFWVAMGVGEIKRLERRRVNRSENK